jgi:uncharacterized protein
VSAGSRLSFVCVVVCSALLAAAVRFERAASRRAEAAVPAERIRTADSPALTDRFGDGTPDFLHLDSAADRDAFRRWFTTLAEFQALRTTPLRPEITDCASLLRYSYRGALHQHDDGWLRDNGLVALDPGPSVAKYNVPHEPLGPAIFRVSDGDFIPADLSNGSFAEFADAKNLLAHNVTFVSRDVTRARPGDLLFYRQLAQDSPFHSMVYLGRSALVPNDSASDWVVYHTGPIDHGPGEMRRVRIADLMRHPSPQWRPLPGNTNFLGVYRWNILKEAQ